MKGVVKGETGKDGALRRSNEISTRHVPGIDAS
jgi:hypothetical protein